MTRKEIGLVAVLVVMATTYICLFTTWFKPKKIGIFYTARQTARQMRRLHNNHDMPYILFGLEGRYRLTEVKVVPLDKFKQNPDTSPVWRLISDSNSVPTQEFAYGQRIWGMKPPVQGERPQDLETNVPYRLFVVAGRAQGSEDFTIR